MVAAIQATLATPVRAAKVRVGGKDFKKEPRKRTNAREQDGVVAKPPIYTIDRIRGTRTRGAGMEAAKGEWGELCARQCTRLLPLFKPKACATASAKLLTLRCAHMTRSAVRDAHPAPLMPRAPPLHYKHVHYVYTYVLIYVFVYICTQQWPGLPGNLTHSATLVAYVYRFVLLFSKFGISRRNLRNITKNERSYFILLQC